MVQDSLTLRQGLGLLHQILMILDGLFKVALDDLQLGLLLRLWIVLHLRQNRSRSAMWRRTTIQ